MNEWEELARREPYFAVLTDERFLRERMSADARRAFFAAGEDDVARLLALVGVYESESVLDFGCGVGRLTLALAKRFTHVTGCDASPTMIALARDNARELGAGNATFVTSLDPLPPASFDVIVSLIVFQHIPVREGEALFARLLELLRPGGAAALHVTFRRPGGRLRRLARQLRARLPLVHRIAQRLEGDTRALPYMQMNEYDRARIEQLLARAGCSAPTYVATNHGGIEGAICVTRKTSGALC